VLKLLESDHLASRQVKPGGTAAISRPLAWEGAIVAQSARRSGYSLLELLIVIGILAACAGLLLAAVQRARASAARLACANNLRQIGIALHQYHDLHDGFPPGTNGAPDASCDLPYLAFTWMAYILPYVEQENVRRQADQAYTVQRWPYVAPHPVDQVIPLYVCPSDKRVMQAEYVGAGLTVAFTSYLGVNGTNLRAFDGIFYNKSATRLTDLQRGSSNTLLVGERPPSADMWWGWWYSGAGQADTTLGDGISGSADVLLGVNEIIVDSSGILPGDLPDGASTFGPGRLDNMADAFHFWSLHGRGANFLFADGSVRFLDYAAAPTLPQLATRSSAASATALGR
jgi:prepilin-type processing-associated H-X9-DG protein/prepilin-type N-terminal cleavage/methylation domain-containing protein